VTPERSARVALRGPLDLVTTLAPLRHGRGDRTIQIARDEAWLAVRTAEGPATLRLALHGARELRADAWGPGAGSAIGTAARLIGEDDAPGALVCRHPLLRELQRRNPGLRLPSSGRVLHALVPTILEQKVTGTEAFRSYGALLRRYGEPAPDPGHAPALLLPPTPKTLAGLPYHAYHPLGVERRRAEVIRAAAARADWLEGRTAAETAHRLRSLPGIGAWTVAEVLRCVFGDPDAVSVGDYHVPNMVAWALAGEPRADDARMLELLAPYRGQRGRVQRLLEVGRVTAPRYGSRMAPRSIASI
jgi:3-methyladenine DNA glycosylase/8-oxoguanine DNA glycosylase